MSACASKVVLFKVLGWIIGLLPFGVPHLRYILTVQRCHPLKLQSWELGRPPLLSFCRVSLLSFCRVSCGGGCSLSKVRSVFQSPDFEAMCDYSIFFECFVRWCPFLAFPLFGVGESIANFMAFILCSSSGGGSWISVFGFCHSGVCGFVLQCHRELETSCTIGFLCLSCLLFLLSSWAVPVPCLFLPLVEKEWCRDLLSDVKLFYANPARKM